MQCRLKKLVNTVCLKSGVGFGPRFLSLQVYNCESFIRFHVHIVVPVVLVKPIDTFFLSLITKPDKHLQIFKHLRGSENWHSLCSEDCFTILDSASSSFQLKLQVAMYILWDQPSLNSQVKHLNLSLLY